MAPPQGHWIGKADILNSIAYVEAAGRARAQNQILLAHTMLRSAQALGAEVDQDAVEATRLTDSQLIGRGSLYQRNMRVVDLLHEHFGDGRLSVVDVGGHTGIMAHMLPQTRYLLCEPIINNMLSQDLADAGLRFDVALSIHVFEHIPDEKSRTSSLRSLRSQKRGSSSAIRPTLATQRNARGSS